MSERRRLPPDRQAFEWDRILGEIVAGVADPLEMAAVTIFARDAQDDLWQVSVISHNYAKISSPTGNAFAEARRLVEGGSGTVNPPTP